jgi:hypothetical protein
MSWATRVRFRQSVRETFQRNRILGPQCAQELHQRCGVPVTPEFKQFLQRFLEGKAEGDYVLRANTMSGKWRYRADFSKAWYSQMKRCGVRCTIHDGRRSFASNLVSHGVSIYKVARWLGDGVTVVEKSYGHLAPADRDIEALSRNKRSIRSRLLVQASNENREPRWS